MLSVTTWWLIEIYTTNWRLVSTAASSATLAEGATRKLMNWQISVRLEHLSHLVSSWSKSTSGRSRSRARYQRTWGAVPKDGSRNPEDTEGITDAMEVEEEGIPEQVLLIEALWTRPFIAYLAREELPADRKEARQIIRRSRSFTLINGELYKRSISGMFQRCIAPEDGISILRDIHEGICGHHAGS